MIKYGLLFSLLTTTAAMASPPYFLIGEEPASCAKNVAERLQAPGDACSETTEARHEALRVVLDTAETGSFDAQKFDAALTGLFLPGLRDGKADLQWRAHAHDVLTKAGITFEETNPAYKLSDRTTFSYDPGEAMKSFVGHYRSVETLYLGLPADTGAGDGSTDLVISDHPEHAPHVFATRYDLRGLQALHHILQARQDSDAFPSRIVLNAVDRDLLHKMLEGGDLLDHVYSLLRFDEDSVGTLEIRDMTGLPEETLARLTLYGFTLIENTRDHAVSTLTFQKQPAPLVAVQEDFNPASSSSASLGSSASLMRSPVKGKYNSLSASGTSPRRLATSAERNRRPRADGIPHMGDYLEANPGMLQKAIEAVGAPPKHGDSASVDEWTEEYVDWRSKVHKQAERLFKASFGYPGTEELFEGMREFRGGSFGGNAPVEFNWIEHLQRHPEVLEGIFAKHFIKLGLSKCPIDVAPYIDALVTPGSGIALTPEHTLKLARYVHKQLIDDMGTFESLSPKSSFPAWVDAPAGFDMHDLSLNLYANEFLEDDSFSARHAFMTTHGVSPEAMHRPIIKRQYQTWLVQQMQEFEINGRQGLPYMPYVPPGLTLEDMVQILRDEISGQIEELAAAVKENPGAVPAAFNLPVVDALGLQRFLGDHRGNIWDLESEQDSYTERQTRRLEATLAQLLMLNAVFTEGAPVQPWMHWTAAFQSPPEGWTSTALMAANPNVLGQFEPWFQRRQPRLVNRSLFDCGEMTDGAGAPECDAPLPVDQPIAVMASGGKEEVYSSGIPSEVEDRIKQVLRRAYLFEEWAKGIDDGSRLMPVKNTNDVDIVDWIKVHQTEPSVQELWANLQELQAQKRGEEGLSLQRRLDLVYTITTDATQKILAEAEARAHAILEPNPTTAHRGIATTRASQSSWRWTVARGTFWTLGAGALAWFGIKFITGKSPLDHIGTVASTLPNLKRS